jgi:hypothetical protein
MTAFPAGRRFIPKGRLIAAPTLGRPPLGPDCPLIRSYGRAGEGSTDDCALARLGLAVAVVFELAIVGGPLVGVVKPHGAVTFARPRLRA